MAPVEWPIAAGPDESGPVAARRGARDRLPCVREDFFLDTRDRLTEQERAVMTAMLADLVAVIAQEIGAALGHSSAGKDDSTLFDQLFDSGLLDIPQLVALLLRRAEEEKVAAIVRSRRQPARARLLHNLAASPEPVLAASAMALILARSRRRDRFDSPRVDLDDVPAEAAAVLVPSIAAAMRLRSGGTDRSYGESAALVLARHDEGKRLEALSFALVHALDRAGELDEQLIAAALADADISLTVEALARRAGLSFETAWAQFVAGGEELALLLRLASVSREFAAELAGQAGGVEAAIAAFDQLPQEAVDGARAWWRLDPCYRAASARLGARNGLGGRHGFAAG